MYMLIGDNAKNRKVAMTHNRSFVFCFMPMTANAQITGVRYERPAPKACS